MTSAVIETKGLTKTYGGKIHAVENLSISIFEGEIYGFLGPNGAGKTTTIKMLATLLDPTSGNATVNGFDIIKQPSKVRESIGIVFQEPSSDELLTGYENLRLGAMIYNVPSIDIEKRINDALELVELTDRKNDLVKTYSGGMRRRLEIARGMLHKPKVLFLDEPTLGLDPRGRARMWDYIKQLSEELKMTVLLTTHYMEEAEFLAHRVCIIDRGKAVAVDTPDDLKDSIGGDVVRIKIDAPDMKAIKKLKYVEQSEYKDGELILTLDNAQNNLQDLLNKVGKVNRVEVRTPTLGDVFLKFTGKDIEKEEEGGSWFDKVVEQSSNKE